MSSNFRQIKSLQEFDFWHIQTADIVELIGPEKTIALLLENYSKYFNDFTWWLSGERSLPFGLLVYCKHGKGFKKLDPEKTVVIILKFEQREFTIHLQIQKMQMEWQTV